MAHLKLPVNKNDHIKGNTNAAVEVVEYGDFQCPYCGEAYPAVKELVKRMGDNVKFVFRHFPLAQIHSNAKSAALAAEAAGAQGKFWEMHDKMFENQDKLDEKNLLKLASGLGLDMEIFENDLKNRTYLEKVEEDFEGGIRSGVNRTPSFYVNGEIQDELSEEVLNDFVKQEHH